MSTFVLVPGAGGVGWYWHRLVPELERLGHAAIAVDIREDDPRLVELIVLRPDVPTRVLVGRDDRFFPLDFQRGVVRTRLGQEIDEIPGGHLVALSKPVELAARLDGFARGSL